MKKSLIRRYLLACTGIVMFLSVFLGLAPTTPTVKAAPAFAYGADVSWLPQMEANGYKFYYRNGTQGDLLKILKTDFGINSIRIRTWVNPSTDPWNGSMNQAATIALAKRVKDEGMNVMIDFHYGDTWNSVGSQVCPVAWQSLSYTQLKTTLYNYTYNFMVALKNEGVTPAWVQVGNETNSGLCRPIGSISNPTQMVGLFNSGYDAVKAVSPSTIAMIHLAGPQRTEMETFLDAFFNNGGKTDLIGFSSYASLGDQPAVGDRVEYLKNKYNKPVLMSEVGGPWNRAQDNKTKITNWINLLKRVGGTGTGVFYWEPESPPGFNDDYQSGAVDANMKWTIAMDAYREASGAGSGFDSSKYYKIKNRTNSKVLDSTGQTTDGSLVKQWSDTASNNRQWQLIDLGTGYYKIKNRTTGKMLDSGGQTTDGSNVKMWTDSTSNNMQWQIVNLGTGYYKLKNRATGKVIDSGGAASDGDNVKMWTDGTSNNLQWSIVQAN